MEKGILGEQPRPIFVWRKPEDQKSMGLGFGVWGLGFRVWGLGFR